MIKEKKTAGSILFDIVNILFFTIFTFMCVYPFYYLIINSISANDLSAAGKILFLPRGIHFSNYIEVFKIPGLIQSAVVSVSRTVIGTLASVVGSSFLGFMFTQKKMWARKFWYRYTIVTMYFNAGLIPWYITMKNLGLTNNFLAYILPAVVTPFNIILVKTYVESIPEALQEAAMLDGAGILKIFSAIMIPLCKPIISTIAIFSAVNQWNAFQDSLLLMTNPRLYPLQFLLYQYMNQASSLATMVRGASTFSSSMATAQTAQSIKMTVSVVVVMPILIVYPALQKYFVKGIMIGSVKG